MQEYVVSFAWRDYKVPEGTLIRFADDTERIFLIQNGRKRQFESGKAFHNSGNDLKNVGVVDNIFDLLFPKSDEG